MRIGILIWQLDIKGGTQRQALELARYIVKNTSHKVTIYAYLYDKNRCYSELCEDLDIRYVKLHNEDDISDYPVSKLEYLYKYAIFFFEIKHKQLLNIIDPDIDVLNPHDSGTYVTAGLWKEKFHKPVVWMMNDLPLYKWNLSHIPKTIGYHLKPKYKQFIRNFDTITVLDRFNKNGVKKNFGKEAQIVRSGLDLAKFVYASRKETAHYKILMTSVLFPHRRMEDAVWALKFLLDAGHSVSIEHVGELRREQAYTKRIFRLVKKLKLEDKINFNGSVSSEQLLWFFRNLDFYVFPNSPQTWGLSVFEAMASGMPVVLTSGCGASEILTGQENCLIVKPNAPEQIAGAITRLISDKDLRARIAKNAFGFVQKTLSWEKYSKEILKLIEESRQVL